LERRDDVPFSFERSDFFWCQAFDAVGWDQIFVAQHHHAQLLERVAVFGGRVILATGFLRLTLHDWFLFVSLQRGRRINNRFAPPHSGFIRQSGNSRNEPRSWFAPSA